MQVGEWDKVFYFGWQPWFVWFDFNKMFSVDIGRWYIRLYIHVTDFCFCRYFGKIRR